MSNDKKIFVYADGFLKVETEDRIEYRAMTWAEMRNEFPDFVASMVEESGFTADQIDTFGGDCKAQLNVGEGQMSCSGGCSLMRVCSAYMTDRDGWPWACRCIVI